MVLSWIMNWGTFRSPEPFSCFGFDITAQLILITGLSTEMLILLWAGVAIGTALVIQKKLIHMSLSTLLKPSLWSAHISYFDGNELLGLQEIRVNNPTKYSRRGEKAQKRIYDFSGFFLAAGPFLENRWRSLFLILRGIPFLRYQIWITNHLFTTSEKSGCIFLQSHKLDKISRWKCSDVLSATVI